MKAFLNMTLYTWKSFVSVYGAFTSVKTMNTFLYLDSICTFQDILPVDSYGSRCSPFLLSLFVL